MSEHTITKSEIIRNIANRHTNNVYIKDVQDIVNTVLDELGDALAQGHRIELRGFGAFSVRKRKARTARNPRTEELVSLGERYAPYFRAGKELRDRLNEAAAASGNAGGMQE